MSVGRVQYTPPQPGCLYPNVSMEYDANEHPENDLQSMDDDKAAVMFKTASKVICSNLLLLFDQH